MKGIIQKPLTHAHKRRKIKYLEQDLSHHKHSIMVVTASHYYIFFYVSSFVLGAKNAAREINMISALVKHPQILGFRVFEILFMLLM